MSLFRQEYCAVRPGSLHLHLPNFLGDPEEYKMPQSDCLSSPKLVEMVLQSWAAGGKVHLSFQRSPVSILLAGTAAV